MPAKKATLLKDESVSDTVYRALRAAILSGEHEGGEPLRQDEIAGQHDVSKIPVREALRRLEMEGLVEFRSRRGAIVKLVSAEEILHLIDIRLALECRAMELAIPNLIDADIRIAGESHEEYCAEKDYERWGELNLRFHHALNDPCDNQQLLSMLGSIEERVGSLMRLRVTEVGSIERPLREHAVILDACIKRDVNGAITALRCHIETSQREVAALFRRKAMK